MPLLVRRRLLRHTVASYGLLGPHQAVVTASGVLVVTDRVAHTVALLTEGGWRTFGGPGNRIGQFSSPCGVAVAHDDGTGASCAICVCDFGNARVQVFTIAAGEVALTRVIGLGHLQQPSCIAVCTKTHECVRSLSNSRIRPSSSERVRMCMCMHRLFVADHMHMHMHIIHIIHMHTHHAQALCGGPGLEGCCGLPSRGRGRPCTASHAARFVSSASRRRSR